MPRTTNDMLLLEVEESLDRVETALHDLAQRYDETGDGGQYDKIRDMALPALFSLRGIVGDLQP